MKWNRKRLKAERHGRAFMSEISRKNFVVQKNSRNFKATFYEECHALRGAHHSNNHDNSKNFTRLLELHGPDWHYANTDEHGGYQWNSWGHRNDYDFNSWGDKKWMLAIGDSNVEGTASAKHELFHEIVAKDRGYVNYNAGIGGTANHYSLWNGLRLLNLANTKPEVVIIRLTDARRYAWQQSLLENAYLSKDIIYSKRDLNEKNSMWWESKIVKDFGASEKLKDLAGYLLNVGSWVADDNPHLQMLMIRDEYKIDKSETRLMMLMFQQYCIVNDIRCILLTGTGHTHRDNWETFQKYPNILEINEMEGAGDWESIPKARDDLHFGWTIHQRIADKIIRVMKANNL